MPRGARNVRRLEPIPLGELAQTKGADPPHLLQPVQGAAVGGDGDAQLPGQGQRPAHVIEVVMGEHDGLDAPPLAEEAVKDPQEPPLLPGVGRARVEHERPIAAHHMAVGARGRRQGRRPQGQGENGLVVHPVFLLLCRYRG